MDERSGSLAGSLLKTAATVAGAWLAGDYAYSRLTAWRAAQQEKQIMRDDDGLREGFSPFNVGPETPDRPAVLLVHGYAGSTRYWEPFATRLAEQGCHVRAMRLPGFGRALGSTSPRRGAWRRAVRAEVDALDARYPGVVAVGHSLGTAPIRDAYIEDPGGFHALGLLTPLLKVSDVRSPLLPVRSWYEILSRTLCFTRWIENCMLPQVNDPTLREYLLLDRYVDMWVIHELFDTIDRIRPRAAEVIDPVYMVVAAQDRVVDSEVAVEWFEQIGSRNKELRVQEKSGHAVQLDFGWQDVADRVATMAKG